MSRFNKGLIGFVVLMAVVWVGLLVSQMRLASKAFSSQKELFHMKVDAVFDESLERIDSLDFMLINSYVGKELRENAITDVYQLGLYGVDDSVFLYTTEDADEEMLLTEGFPYSLLTLSDEAAHLDILYIYFPEIEKRFRWDVIMGYLVIALLLVLITCCFISFIIIILKQRKVNDFREKMVHNITHELKTPLTTIGLASQFLLDDSVEKEDSVKHSYLKMISDEAKSMQDLVDEVLVMFRNDKTSRDCVDVPIHKLLPTIAEIYGLSLDECKGKIVFDFQAQNDVVSGDLPHLTNAFSNLIDNAIKYRKDDLLITVSTRNVDDSIEICFADNGIGIDKSDQNYIFEPFMRVNTDNEHYVKGYGIGLNYVLHVVEYHKGTIRIESELDHGATFIVTLPLKK
jgi:signal transduction histidine kinase